MLIVDGQIHLWEKGTPSPPHRQEPYSGEQAIAAMDQAGVDRALIHPVLWDPDSNELAVEAVQKRRPCQPNSKAPLGASCSPNAICAGAAGAMRQGSQRLFAGGNGIRTLSPSREIGCTRI